VYHRYLEDTIARIIGSKDELGVHVASSDWSLLFTEQQLDCQLAMEDGGTIGQGRAKFQASWPGRHHQPHYGCWLIRL
jgi:hypothetical protein